MRQDAAVFFHDKLFHISIRDKEMVTYWEGIQGFTFDAAWGVSPGHRYVPSETEWDAVTPPWLRGRRDDVICRLVAGSGHIVETGPDRMYRASDSWRDQIRSKPHRRLFESRAGVFFLASAATPRALAKSPRV